MTKITMLKSLLLQAILVSATIFSITSCENKPKAKDTEEVADMQNDGKEDPMAKERDEEFLQDAAEINWEKIQLGQLAQQKGMTPDVKAMGKMMEDAHTKAMADLTSLAGMKSISLPTSPTEDVKDVFERLSGKTGLEFDKDYCDRMVQSHKAAVDRFERAANNAQDADIKAWASKMLPDLRAHLDHAMMCENKVKEMK